MNKKITLTPEQYEFAKRRALTPGYLAKPLEEMLIDAYLHGMSDAVDVAEPKEAR